MLKKIVLGSLLAGLVVILVLGAVNRTNARTEEQTGEAGRQGQAATEAYNGRGGQEEQAAPGQGGGRWADKTEGQGQWQNSAPQADVQPTEWLTIQGTVSSVADDLVEVRTDAGEVIPFEGRPLSFAQEQGFSPEVGDAVTLAGFDEDGEFKIGQITLGHGTITLRDADGRPGWAGRGRRS
jgi:outer membrane protein assembly factor BamB